MKYLSELELSKMPLNRLKNIRTQVLAKINNSLGYYCCEGKCQWFENENYINSSEKNEDYAYRDLINKYYDEKKTN